MGFLKERWTEAEVANLPEAPHNCFERHPGSLVADCRQLYAVLARDLSAFANSGGGHIILGQGADRRIDGVPRAEGRTPLRDWLEQNVPTLVSYPLEEFRVHTVVRDPAASRIPADRELIVIDVGPSRLAPHQASYPADHPQYYYRQGGQSLPAPHHYLEALRNRTTFAVLEAKLTTVSVGRSYSDHGQDAIVEIVLRFTVKNVSRVACRSWDVAFELYGDTSPVVSKESFLHLGMGWSPEPTAGMILPTRTASKADVFGFRYLRDQKLGWQVRNRLLPLEVHYYPISENQLGELRTAKLAEVVEPDRFEKDLGRSLEAALGYQPQ